MDRRVRLRIHYGRPSDVIVPLIVALLAAWLAADLAWGRTGASAAAAQAPADRVAAASSSQMRQFYLTPADTYNGANVRTACDSGYHTASLWEILDPSHLKYNLDKGYKVDDSGKGPPANPAGWVRTGSSAGASGSAGFVNCQAYSSASGGAYGSVVWLGGAWDGATRSVHVWDAAAWPCNLTSRVWCVEDNVTTHVYLPGVLRSAPQ